jgi:hypothetical protein
MAELGQFALPPVLTSAAFAVSTLFNHQVGSLIRMARRAVRLDRIAVWARATAHICQKGDHFYMCRIHASAIATEMVNLETDGDCLAAQFISKPMCANGAARAVRATSYPEGAVSVRVDMALPRPTGSWPSRLIHKLPKAFCGGQRRLKGHRETSFLGVTGQAVSAALPLYFTRMGGV